MSDGRAFDEFYLASRDRLVLQVAALTGDSTEALDHVQEAFIRSWTRWDRISTYDDPEGWVRRVALNLATSRWRQARRVVLRAAPQEGRIYLDPDQQSMVEALARLGRREREAIVMHHVIGLSIEEISVAMSAPPGTVKSWLSRGRIRLARELDADQEEVTHER